MKWSVWSQLNPLREAHMIALLREASMPPCQCHPAVALGLYLLRCRFSLILYV